MDNTIAAVSAVILLIGCCTGCGKEKKVKLPKICFIYSESFEGGFAKHFCDCNGNYYNIISDDVKLMNVDELTANYESGELKDDIELICEYDKNELEEKYAKFIKAAKSGECQMKSPDMMPDVEAPNRRWSGIYTADDGTPVMVDIHEDQRMTDIYSQNPDINEVYEWFAGNLQKCIK
jgi:hypothetical protein